MVFRLLQPYRSGRIGTAKWAVSMVKGSHQGPRENPSVSLREVQGSNPCLPTHCKAFFVLVDPKPPDDDKAASCCCRALWRPLLAGR